MEFTSRFRNIIQERALVDLVELALRRGVGVPTGSLRLLPDFLIIGAQRAGTTSLFNYLCQHPEIHPSFPKEINYFSNYFQKGTHWYRSHFPLSLWKRIVNRNGERKFITGEATPYYLFHPHTSRRASQVIPKTQIIVLLRNPVERAYSHYYHEVRIGVESLPFEDALAKEEERLSQEKERLADNDDYCSFNYQNYSYLLRGIYIDQLQVWRMYFPRESMLILSSESFFVEPCTTITQVTDFLGLSRWRINALKKYNYSPYPKMCPSTRERLVAYFRPHNERLFEYLKVDYGWNS